MNFAKHSLTKSLSTFTASHRKYTKVLTNWQVSLFLLEGYSGEEKIKLLVAGPKLLWSYFCQKIFTKSYSEKFLKTTTTPKVPCFVRQNQSMFDLAIICTDNFSARLFFHRSYAIAPSLVNVSHEVSAGLPKSRNLRRAIQQIKKENWQYQTTNSEQDLEYFYNQLHKPYTLQRHQKLAVIHPYKTFRRTLEDGFLTLIIDDNIVIGGVLCRQHSTSLQACYFGVHDGFIQKNIFYAMYLYVIERAKKLNLSHVNLGGCRPCLKDGILQHKRKWNVTIAPSPRSHYNYLFYWPKVNPAVTTFFRNTGLIIQDRTGKLGCILDYASKPKVKKIWIKGLEKMYFVDRENKCESELL